MDPVTGKMIVTSRRGFVGLVILLGLGLADPAHAVGSGSFVSPVCYGAAGDGITDDSAAVQSAFDSGRPILLERPYLVGNLTAPPGLTVHGIPGCVLRRKPEAHHTISINAGAGGSADPSGNVEGVRIVGVAFDDDVITNGFREGDAQLNLNACSDVLVSGCTFSGFRSDAIYLGSSNALATERHNQRITIVDSLFDGVNQNNRNAVSVLDCSSLLITGNIFRRCTRADMPGAIDVEPNPGSTFAVLRDIEISRNLFEDIGGSACVGSKLESASSYATIPGNWVIAGNTFRNTAPTNASVNISTAGHVEPTLNHMNIVVAGNTFTAVARYAHFDGVRGVDFSGNYVAGSVGAGTIGANYTCSDISFERNTFLRVGASDEGAPCAITIVNGKWLRIAANAFVECGLKNGKWGMCVVLGGGGTSDYVDMSGANTMWPGRRMTDVSYKSSTHTKGLHNSYVRPFGAVGGTALP